MSKEWSSIHQNTARLIPNLKFPLKSLRSNKSQGREVDVSKILMASRILIHTFISRPATKRVFKTLINIKWSAISIRIVRGIRRTKNTTFSTRGRAGENKKRYFASAEIDGRSGARDQSIFKPKNHFFLFVSRDRTGLSPLEPPLNKQVSIIKSDTTGIEHD